MYIRNNNIRKQDSAKCSKTDTHQANRPPLSYPNIPQSPVYMSSTKLQARIDLYFDRYITDTKMRPSFAGLAWFLGFKTKQELVEYMEKPPRKSFGDAIKRARLKIEEVTLSDAQGNNVGSMFYAKSEFNYIEKQQIQVDTPPALSSEQEDRLRKVAALWERERRRELGEKVKAIHS